MIHISYCVFYRDLPDSHDNWIKLLQQQEMSHKTEIQKWQNALKKSIHFLRQVMIGRKLLPV